MSSERIVINISRDAFTDAVLTALERDTGALPIVPEILRIIKIKQRREELRETRLRNLAQRHAPQIARKKTITPPPTRWQRIKRELTQRLQHA